MPLVVLGFTLLVFWGRCSPNSSLKEVLHCPSLDPDPHSFASASPHLLDVPGLHHPRAEGFRMLWSHRYPGSSPAFPRNFQDFGKGEKRVNAGKTKEIRSSLHPTGLSMPLPVALSFSHRSLFCITQILLAKDKLIPKHFIYASRTYRGDQSNQ